MENLNGLLGLATLGSIGVSVVGYILYTRLTTTANAAKVVDLDVKVAKLKAVCSELSERMAVLEYSSEAKKEEVLEMKKSMKELSSQLQNVHTDLQLVLQTLKSQVKC